MSKNFFSNKENLTLNVPTMGSKDVNQQNIETPYKENIFNSQMPHSEIENEPEFQKQDELLMKRKREMNRSSVSKFSLSLIPIY